MNRFNAVYWARISRVLVTVRKVSESVNPETLLRTEEVESAGRLAKVFRDFEGGCQAMGLTASAISTRRIIALLANRKSTVKEFTKLADELLGRLDDEMSQGMYLALTAVEAHGYDDPIPFGQAVADAFPSVAFDIEEATKCRILDRGTACAFHLMRGVEAVLRAMAATLEMPTLSAKTNPTWQRVLQALDAEVKRPAAERTPAWAEDPDFYSGLTSQLWAVKNAWRNPTMHVEQKYTASEAADIWQHTGSLMRLAATKLHEEPTPTNLAGPLG